MKECSVDSKERLKEDRKNNCKNIVRYTYICNDNEKKIHSRHSVGIRIEMERNENEVRFDIDICSVTEYRNRINQIL